MDPLWTFAERVAEHFGLGVPLGPPAPIPVSQANRLWKLSASAGDFIVKEKAFDRPDAERLAGRRRAASFELGAYRGGLPVPEPMLSVDGEVIEELMGSRSVVVPVRVHRWVDAVPPDPPTSDEVGRAGELLAGIQRLGMGFEVGPRSDMYWWDEDPLVVLDRLSEDDRGGWRVYGGLVSEAMALIDEGVARSAGRWVYTHGDHKPENCLRLAGRGLVVIDWDECGLNSERLEATESALRWAGVSAGHVDPVLLRAFVSGYERAGGVSLEGLTPFDGAKWVAALAGWFSFMGRRSLGDYDDTPPERAEARQGALWALQRLRSTMEELPGWLGG